MIFTIGHEKNYRKAIADNGVIQKMGKREPCEQWPDGYEGGCCFKTFKQARAAIKEYYAKRGFIVWGLETTWENTQPSKDHPWNDLIKDCDIIPLAQVSVKNFQPHE